MGLNVGQIPASLVNARADVSAATRQARTGEEDAPALARRNSEQERPQAGFGENTLSPGGAALQALDVNLREARRAVPSVEELQAEYQARRAEQLRESGLAELAATATEETPALEARVPETEEPGTEEVGPEEQSTRPEPAPNARQFEAQQNTVNSPDNATGPRFDVLA